MSSSDQVLSSTDNVLVAPETANSAEPIAARPRQRWILGPSRTKKPQPRRRSDIPTLIAELLLARGIHSAAEADAFLNPRIEHLLDPYSMLGMDRAVHRIHQAFASQEPVFIYGDYDVDGPTPPSCSRPLSKNSAVPPASTSRIAFAKATACSARTSRTLPREGIRLVISVDTGIRAFAAADVLLPSSAST